MRIKEIVVRQVDLPLVKPYFVSFNTYHSFVPVVVQVKDEDGREGWGEAQISPGGATEETRASGYQFLKEQAQRIVGMTAADARAELDKAWTRSVVASSAMFSAIQMLERNPLLAVPEDVEVPLLTPFSATNLDEIPDEVEKHIEDGYRTIKVKVGKSVDDDLKRVACVQDAVAGRAVIRIDANFGYSRQDGEKFARSVDPADIEHFEQPCLPSSWEDNAAVAAVTRVPVMLDESIKDVADVEQACAIAGVGACKLKLRRTGTLERLDAGLSRIKQLGRRPVIGDGTANELSAFFEACLWRRHVDNAGEFNGFLKPVVRLLHNPMEFRKGSIFLKASYWPSVDEEIVEKHTIAKDRYANTAVGAGLHAARAS